MAAAVALGVIAIIDINSSSTHQPFGASPLRTATSASIDSVAFLQRAAMAAQSQADVAPRPEQFLCVQQTGYQAWLSIDGAHDGLIDNGDKTATPGCRNGVTVVQGNAGQSLQPCTADPAYLADAPTSASAMAKYIIAQAGGDTPNSVGKEVLQLAEFRYLRPAARAALYGAAQLLPGLTLSATTVSNLNNSAIAITWSLAGNSSTVLVFDPSSYAYLGVVTTGLAREHGESYVVRRGVVDAVGQLP